jgi:hypothetical protein
VAVEQDIARQIREAFLAGSRDTLVDRMGITILEATALTAAYRRPGSHEVTDRAVAYPACY